MTYANAALDDALDGANANISHMQLHDGDPGAAGTNNVAAEVAGRIAFTFPAASSQSASDTGDFAITGAGGPYGWVTFWDASTGGNYQGQSTLTPAESFAGAGTLSVTATSTAANA